MINLIKNLLNTFLIPMFTMAVMSITLLFLFNALTAIKDFSAINLMFFLMAVFSIGLHWKATKFVRDYWC